MHTCPRYILLSECEIIPIFNFSGNKNYLKNDKVA